MDFREQVHHALRDVSADQLKTRLETLLEEVPRSAEQHALERFRAYFDQSDDLFLVMESDLTISYLNTAARELLHVKKSFQLGRLEEIVSDESVRSVEAYARKCRDSGERVYAVHKLLTREGTRLFDSVFVPVMDAANHVSSVVLVAHRVNQRVTDRYAQVRMRFADHASIPPDEIDTYTAELRALHDLLSMPANDMREMCREYLQAGLRFLDCESGFLSRIQGRTYSILYAGGDTHGVGAGSRFVLEDTLCRRVVEEQQTLVASDVATDEMLAGRRKHCSLEPGSFISTPIWVDGNLFGTMNFFSAQKRLRAFSRRDAETIEIMAGGIGRAVTIQRERKETDRFFRISPDLLGLVDLDGTLLRFNHAWTELLGYEPEDLYEMPCLELIHPNDREEARAAFQHMMETSEQAMNFECRMQTSEGGYRWVQWHAASSEQENNIAVVLSDLGERKRMEEELHSAMADLAEARHELEKLASADALTGIANNRRFNSFYQHEWNRAARYGTPLSVVVLDIDDFHAYNELYGHDQGDEVLRQIALELNHGVVRPGDLVARIGPEEFGMVLADTDEDGSRFVAEQMMERVRGLGIRHERSSVADVITVSVGVASAQPYTGVPRDSLVDEAMNAMGTAKDQGKNCCVGVVHTSVVLPPENEATGSKTATPRQRPQHAALQ